MSVVPFADHHEAVRRTRHRPTYQQDVLLRVDRDDLEVLGREILAAHATGAALALDDARRVRRRADRSRLLAVRGTVRRVARDESVALDDALEAAALGDTLDVDVPALLEQRHRQAAADFHSV